MFKKFLYFQLPDKLSHEIIFYDSSLLNYFQPNHKASINLLSQIYISEFAFSKFSDKFKILLSHASFWYFLVFSWRFSLISEKRREVFLWFMGWESSLVRVDCRGSLFKGIRFESWISFTDKHRINLWYFWIALPCAIYIRVSNSLVYCGTDSWLMFFFEAKPMFVCSEIIGIARKLGFNKLLLRVMPCKLTLFEAKLVKFRSELMRVIFRRASRLGYYHASTDW